MNYYIADWHYDHKNVIGFDNRPFFTVSEMNKALIDNWNSAVKPEDTCYVLGDMFWCNDNLAISVLEQLNGKKILIKGNHDKCKNPEFVEQFELITDYLEIKDGNNNIVLCHYPIPCFKNHCYGWYHFYGHVHTSFENNMMENIKFQMENWYDKKCRMFNVGCMIDYMEYTPRTFDEIT